MSFHQPKTPKSEEVDKGPFTNHKIHDDDNPIDYHNKEFLMFTSIDPGVSRFAMRIEKRYKNTLMPITTELQVASSFKQFITDGDGNSRLYAEVTKFMDQYIEVINKCDFVIIERQMKFNYKMVRLSQHLVTYFHFRLKNNYMRTRVIEQDARVKTRSLGASSDMGKKQVKEWAYAVALQLIQHRRDNLCIDFFNKLRTKTEKFDPADTIVQLEAFCVFNKFRKTELVLRHPSFEKFFDLSSGQKVSEDFYNQSSLGSWEGYLPNMDFNTPSTGFTFGVGSSGGGSGGSGIHSPKPSYSIDVPRLETDISFTFGGSTGNVPQPTVNVNFSINSGQQPNFSLVQNNQSSQGFNFSNTPTFSSNPSITSFPSTSTFPSAPTFSPNPSTTSFSSAPTFPSTSTFASVPTFSSNSPATSFSNTPTFSSNLPTTTTNTFPFNPLPPSYPPPTTYPPPSHLPVYPPSSSDKSSSFFKDQKSDFDFSDVRMSTDNVSPIYSDESQNLQGSQGISFEFNNLEPNYPEKRSLSRGSSGGLLKFRPGIVDRTKPGETFKNISPPKTYLSSSADSLQKSGLFNPTKQLESSGGIGNGFSSFTSGNGNYGDNGTSGSRFLHLENILNKGEQLQPIFTIS